MNPLIEWVVVIAVTVSLIGIGYSIGHTNDNEICIIHAEQGVPTDLNHCDLLIDKERLK